MGKGGINNPFNLIATAIRWDGETTRPGDRFESFPTLYDGTRAGIKNILNAQRLHGVSSCSALISRYAPQFVGGRKENNTPEYIEFVKAAACAPGSDAINLENPTTLVKVAAAMWKFEGSGIPLSLATIRRVVAELLGASA